MRTYVLERQQQIRRTRSETFAFFADAFKPGAHYAIVPAFSDSHSAANPNAGGSVLEYRLSTSSESAFRWRSLIEEWTPNVVSWMFSSMGPTRLATHPPVRRNRQTFHVVQDHIEYQLPLGVVGRLANGIFLAKMLERIFEHRATVIDRLFSRVDSQTSRQER